MTKELKPRYTITTLSTLDLDLVVRSKEVKKLGYTHEDIYRRGVEELLKDSLTKVNN